MIHNIIMNTKVFIILVLIFFLVKPLYTKFVQINMCLDVGICAEGIKTKIDGNLVEINKENCIKYNRIWIEETKVCNVKRI